MFSPIAFLKNSKIWMFQDLFIVLFLTILLIVIYNELMKLSQLNWTLFSNSPDIDFDTLFAINELIAKVEIGTVALSAFISPFAFFYSIKNNRLTLPIRLLAASESMAKFVFGVCYTSTSLCSFFEGPLECPDSFWTITDAIFSYVPYSVLNDVAQYSQMLISASRFFAVSFNGLFFQSTLKWPYLQLLIPYLFRYTIWHVASSIFVVNQQFIQFLNLYIVPLPYFLMCSLDLMTRRKMKALKLHGSVARAERWLMLQMIANSIFTHSFTIIYFTLVCIAKCFFGRNVIGIFGMMVSLWQFLLFNLTASTMMTVGNERMNMGSQNAALDVCVNLSGFHEVSTGVFYNWNGLPIPSTSNDSQKDFVATAMFLEALLALLLNIFCARTIFRNSRLSKAVKCYLLFDCYCRLNEAFTFIYQAHCVLTWACVNPIGSPISGLMINRLVTAFHLGMLYSMQMLGHGLCLNRLFAVFFNGIFYKKIERIAIPHSVLLWALPIGVYLYQIGDLVNPDGFRCYGCWLFTPLEFCNTCMATWNETVYFLTKHFDYIMYGILVTTVILDVITLWKVRMIKKSSQSKKRADIRLSVMLVTTHLITIGFLLGNYITNCVFTAESPIFYYLILEVSPFILHCFLGTVVIIFNLQSKLQKVLRPSSLATVSNKKESAIKRSLSK